MAEAANEMEEIDEDEIDKLFESAHDNQEQQTDVLRRVY